MADPRPKKIVDYLVTSDVDLKKLELYVKDFIKSGYVPAGGISVFNSKYFQAMVKFG